MGDGGGENRKVIELVDQKCDPLDCIPLHRADCHIYPLVLIVFAWDECPLWQFELFQLIHGMRDDLQSPDIPGHVIQDQLLLRPVCLPGHHQHIRQGEIKIVLQLGNSLEGL